MVYRNLTTPCRLGSTRRHPPACLKADVLAFDERVIGLSEMTYTPLDDGGRVRSQAAAAAARLWKPNCR
jgi:hypothetical protein